MTNYRRVNETAFRATVHDPDFWGVPIDMDYLPQLNDESRVLDIGCGTADSRIIQALREKAGGNLYVGRLDYFPDTVAANPGERRIVGSATALPIGSRAIDAVVTSELTSDNRHFKQGFGPPNLNTKRLLHEIARVTRLGGYWIAYNEDISPDYPLSRPPGFTAEYRMQETVKINPENDSFGLPLGIFRKVAEPISPALIGQKTPLSWRWFSRPRQEYADQYSRAINRAYPVEQVIDPEILKACKENDMTALNASDPYFRLGHYYKNNSTVPSLQQFFVASAKAGRWVPMIIPFNYPDPERKLAELSAPESPNRMTDTEDRLRYDVLLGEEFYVRLVGKQLILLPRQELLDKLVEFRYTYIDDNLIQRPRVSPSAA